MGRSYESAERTPVENSEIARVLTEIRTLMEFAGEPYFKFMAYERAAAAIQNAGPATELVASSDLQKLPGVGKTIAARIVELVETGQSAYHQELLGKYPPSLFEVLGVQGVGMKTAQQLFEQNGIASLTDLERAIDSGALVGAPRLGKKTLENMKRGILAYKGRRQRTPIGTALPLAREIIAYVRSGAAVNSITYAGSLRRHEVTVGDIDIVCTSSDAQAVIRRFVDWERAEAVLAEGPTKASIWLDGGLQIDLRVLADDVYGNLLQHFTGSREHNIQLRELAVRKGLRVSENGILNVATLQNLTCRTEEEVYAALGMAYIPPEMRLGLGEIEAALDGTLPRPLDLSDLRGDFHMHCTWSDGVDSLETMIAAAAARGYEYHSISDHSWGRGATYGLDPNVLRDQRERVREIGGRHNVHTLCASEVDILPDGSLDYDDTVLADLDLVIASVHSVFAQTREEMTARLIRACENPYVTVIGHPTGRNVGGFGGYAFDADAVFAAAARTGTALEIDGQPSRLDLPSSLARHARSYGVTFSVDSDAHSADQLENVAFGVGQARRAWVTAPEVLNTRPLADVLAFIHRKRALREVGI
ncbi:MAG TPA: DNA polymerase/3'-5' exonuclease PolX [Candidatus Baltobacteraceae bacterium]